VGGGRRWARSGGQCRSSPVDKPPLAPSWREAVMVGKSNGKARGRESLEIMLMACVSHDASKGDPGHSVFIG